MGQKMTQPYVELIIKYILKMKMKNKRMIVMKRQLNKEKTHAFNNNKNNNKKFTTTLYSYHTIHS